MNFGYFVSEMTLLDISKIWGFDEVSEEFNKTESL